MDYTEFATRFLQHRQHAEVRAFAEVLEGGRRYPLLSAFTPGRRTLLITSGFHGDEIAGPLTLLTHFEEIAAYAAARSVGLQVYPCLNPSGFEDGTRYNRSQEAPNNDFLRYEVEPGVWVGELVDGQRFLRHRVFTHGPKETRALCAELERLAAPDAALDIHQDPYLGGAQSYAYTFGERAPFLPLLAATHDLVPLATAAQVDEGVHTDDDGLVVLHDGSVTDYFHRRGVGLTAALETTTEAPADASDGVNLVWIRGFIDLVARGMNAPLVHAG
jgi:predicted deacylase